jgi:hypothetical protein
MRAPYYIPEIKGRAFPISAIDSIPVFNRLLSVFRGGMNIGGYIRTVEECS